MAAKTYDTDVAVVGKVSQSGTPSAPTDLINKSYFDGLVGINQSLFLNLSAGQTIPNEVLTPVAWTNERSDVSGWHTANSADVTLPAGRYIMTIQWSWDLVAPGTRFHHLEVEEGGGAARIVAANAKDPSSAYNDSTGNMVYLFESGSTSVWRMQVYQNSGSGLKIGEVGSINANRPLASDNTSAAMEWGIARLSPAPSSVGGGLSNGDYGDVVVSGGGTTLTVESVGGLAIATQVYADNIKRFGVRAGSVTNVTRSGLNNTISFGGVTLATNDLIFLGGQTTASENGLYVVRASGGPLRISQLDASSELVPGTQVFIQAGTLVGTTYVCTATGATPWVPDSSTSTWVVLATGSAYTAGGTDIAVTDGGTGVSTLTTAYGLLAAGTTATGAVQTLAAGATTTVLVGGGASALPIWTTASGSGAPVRATSPTLVTPALGTPSALVLTNATLLPAAALVASTSQAVGFGTIELGHASDTTIARISAGKISVEGVEVVLLSGAQTLTGKTLTSPVINTPTGIAKTDVGLGSVDNTADTAKPVSTAQQTALDAKVDKAVTINAQTGTTYTLVLTDASKLVTLNNAGAITLTVPTNSSVAFPIGTSIDLLQLGAGQVTVAAAGGVTLNGNPGYKIAAQYQGGTLIKLSSNTWVLVGALAA